MWNRRHRLHHHVVGAVFLRLQGSVTPDFLCRHGGADCTSAGSCAGAGGCFFPSWVPNGERIREGGDETGERVPFRYKECHMHSYSPPIVASVRFPTPRRCSSPPMTPPRAPSGPAGGAGARRPTRPPRCRRRTRRMDSGAGRRSGVGKERAGTGWSRGGGVIWRRPGKGRPQGGRCRPPQA